MSHFTCAESNTYMGRLKYLNWTFDLDVEFNRVASRVFIKLGKRVELWVNHNLKIRIGT